MVSGGGDDAVDVIGLHGPSFASAAIPAFPGAQQLGPLRRARERVNERVLARAAADDQHPARARG